MSETELLTLSVPADTGYFPAIMLAVRECASKLGFEATECDRICLALEEAMQNAIAYGYGGTRDKLRISLIRASTGLKIILASRGLALDEEQLPRYDPALAHAGQDTTGLGFHLIKEMVDTVSLSVLDDGHREISMLKRLSVQRVRDADEDSVEGGVVSRGEREGVQHTLRLAEPGDAETISRLALRAHGTVMFNEHIYYPDRVRAMIESGEMVSAVAVAESGGIMGHGALVVPASGSVIEELTYGFVDDRFRSRGCASELARFLMAGATARGAYALVAFAVTSHVYSQRAIELLTFKECALLLATSPATWHWDDGDGEQPGRIGNLVYIKHLRKPEAMDVHVPLRHRDMVGKIFAHRGVPARFMDISERVEPTGQSQFFTEASFKEGWALIGIQAYGADSEALVRGRLENACASQLPVIQLMLPLRSPATLFMCERFEAMDFFFAGVGTGQDCSENIILQYVNEADPGYDSVQVLSDFAKELLGYVRSCHVRSR